MKIEERFKEIENHIGQIALELQIGASFQTLKK